MCTFSIGLVIKHILISFELWTKIGFLFYEFYTKIILNILSSQQSCIKKISLDYLSIVFTHQNDKVLSMFSRKIKNFLLKHQFIRQIHRDGHAKVTRTDNLSLSQSLKNKLMAPAGRTGMYIWTKYAKIIFNFSIIWMNQLISAFIIGERALISGSVFGFGYLCYSLGTKKDILIVDKSM